MIEGSWTEGKIKDLTKVWAEFDSHWTVRRSNIFKRGKEGILCLFNLDTMANSVVSAYFPSGGGERHKEDPTLYHP